MYRFLLFLHGLTRWAVVVAMLVALIQVWSGVLGRRPWGARDAQAGSWFTHLTSLQFVLGMLLFVFPYGLAQAALGNLGQALVTPELWFFGIAHPLLMSLAVGLAHLGRARARKAKDDTARFRWALSCYSTAAVLILIAIPWWRPLLRGF
jgi:hypothetical protein